MGCRCHGELLRLNEKARKKLTTAMSIFQMWYFAKDPGALLIEPRKLGRHFVDQAQTLFPDLKNYPRFHQLALGATALKERLASKQGE